jgi:hypothetical protein
MCIRRETGEKTRRSVSIDQAYLNVLVVISKLLGQSILGMRQLPRMIYLFKKKIGCVIKINNTGKGQCRGLKTKIIENQEIGLD